MRESAADDIDERLLKRQIILFFAFAYAFAWIFFVPLGLSRAGLGWLPFELSLPVMTVLGSLGPSASALVTLRMTERRWPTIRSRANPKWVLVSLIVTPILIAFTFAVVPACILIVGPLARLRWAALLSGSVYGVSTLIGGPLGEEPGWRGFALPRLQILFGPARASLLLGFLWAAWHLPLFLCKAWTSSGLLDYVLIVSGFSFLLTFLFNLSTGSVITAIAAHAFFNTVSRWLNGLLDDAPLRSSPSPELVLGLSGWAMALLLLAVSRGRLAYSKSTGMPKAALPVTSGPV